MTEVTAEPAILEEDDEQPQELFIRPSVKVNIDDLKNILINEQHPLTKSGTVVGDMPGEISYNTIDTLQPDVKMIFMKIRE